MDQEQKEKILSFLGRCQNGSAEAGNIARYLGIRSAWPLLLKMKSERLITQIGSTRWRLSEAGSQPEGAWGATGSSGDTEVSGLPAASRTAESTSYGRRRSVEQPWSTKANYNSRSMYRRASVPEEQPTGLAMTSGGRKGSVEQLGLTMNKTTSGQSSVEQSRKTTTSSSRRRSDEPLGLTGDVDYKNHQVTSRRPSVPVEQSAGQARASGGVTRTPGRRPTADQLGLTELKLTEVEVDGNNQPTSKQASAPAEPSQRHSDVNVHVSS